jgi:uncharacterized protein
LTYFKRVALTLPAAFFLWCVTFALPFGNFWLKLTSSATLLAALGVGPVLKQKKELFRLTKRSVFVGIFSALLLYGVFWLGKEVSVALFPFASREIGNVYLTKSQLNPTVIGLLLFFVMGPAEEVYWRGFVQSFLTGRFGEITGLLATSCAYALIHIFAFNFMLLVAAFVCGLFWGLLYLWKRNLVTVMLSHALWDLATFVLFPFN